MLTHEDNELLCRIGPQAPMGQMVRRYWVPAVMSDELEADGAPRRNADCAAFIMD
jgi:phthalate 4,5-dioxygenase oxygenase subunit